MQPSRALPYSLRLLTSLLAWGLCLASAASAQSPPADDAFLQSDVAEPTPADRARRAKELARDASPAAERELLTLLADKAPEVRLSVLELLSDRRPGTGLRSRVHELAESDESLLVRGRARILQADWSLVEPVDSAANRNARGTSQVQTRSRSETGTITPRTPPPALGGMTRDISQFRRLQPSSHDPGALFGTRPARLAPPARETPRSSPLFDREVRPAGQEALYVPPPPEAGDDDLFAPPRSVEEYGWDDPLFQPRDPATDAAPAILDEEPEQPFLEGPAPLEDDMLFRHESDEPLGFSGPSGILPTEEQESAHFVPIEDRWRVGIPLWDRYATPTPTGADAPFEPGAWWNPFRQHVLKGDYPIIGQHTFLNITASSILLNEFRQVPTPTTPFESTVNPFEEDFFGNPNQYFTTNFFRLKFDLFHGNAAFKPVDWRVVAEPVFNMNYLDVGELGVVNTNVRDGTTRFRDYMALEQWFVEAKLADLSPHYDFLSIRAGSQPFVSDFRGFIFSDVNRAVRLFGTREANRDQFNLAVFSQQEKDTNSGLNTFHDREQTVVIGNYYRQDFLFPGYTAQASVHYNHDEPTFKFDKNNFLVRPDPTGIFQPHQIDVAYLGFAGEGHIERYNIAHAFYWALGRDSLNPLASREVSINAQMAAIELSYDRDWVRFRGSYFYASGDRNIKDDRATGFDAIFDNPNFAGGQFSYWQRQAIRLFGVNLVQRESLLPDLRASKIQGQTNFVNPGLNLLNLGMDFEVTPRLRVISNANYLWFDTTEVLEQFVFQSDIHREIGVDLSLGTEYRPLLNDNVIVIAGISSLLPGRGFKDLYEQADPLGLFPNQDTHLGPLAAAFMEVSFTF